LVVVDVHGASTFANFESLAVLVGDERGEVAGEFAEGDSDEAVIEGDLAGVVGGNDGRGVAGDNGDADPAAQKIKEESLKQGGYARENAESG
jgi:hypothetical protein